MSSQRLAVVQAGSTLFNTPKTLERMQAHCEELHRLGVQLAVFPEAYIGGYPKDWISAHVWGRVRPRDVKITSGIGRLPLKCPVPRFSRSAPWLNKSMLIWWWV